MAKVHLRLRVPGRRKWVAYCCGGTQRALVVARVWLCVIWFCFTCLCACVCMVVATSSVWKKNNKSNVVGFRSYNSYHGLR